MTKNAQASTFRELRWRTSTKGEAAQEKLRAVLRCANNAPGQARPRGNEPEGRKEEELFGWIGGHRGG